ncbi:unnamed protein product [Symbiodinium natans]|uniref:Uncharacterized protein n=1 Tax=Symbiodinium natans TaxID=878477 RepID=A0A812U997_9DINO|nr:unnamed protein product [Symbiodinium natans]
MAAALREVPRLVRAADAHSSALAEASTSNPGSQPPLRMVVYGEGLVAAHATSALAIGLSDAMAAAGHAVEVSACLFHGLTAAELLAQIDAPELRDLRGRRGPGLRHLLSDVLLLVAGSCDLGLKDAKPEEVLASLRGLVQEAQALAQVVFVMALPDINKSAQRASFVGATLPARRHATNTGLARWAATGVAKWINPAALLPCGPRSVAAGHWDGSMLSEKGAQALANRLVAQVLPHIQVMLDDDKGLQSDSKMLDDLAAESAERDGALPSLDAFMEAFRLDDAQDSEAVQHPPPAWEVDAAVVLQRGLRRVVLSGSRSHRSDYCVARSWLALARLAVRQALSKGCMAPPLRTLRTVVSTWGVRLTAG